jgi:uncharacterized protein YggE
MQESHEEEPSMKPALKTIAAILILWLASTSPVCAQEDSRHQRSISVSGTAEVQVLPDEAVLTLAIDSTDKDLSVAKTQNDSRVRKLITLAKDAGVEAKHIQTSALTMAPEYSEEKIPKFLGFKVSQTLVVELMDLSKYDALMTNVLRAGVNRVDGLQFVVSEPRKYRDEARSKALTAAREKAVAMAAVLGQTIGKPVEINEGDDFASTYSQSNEYVPARARRQQEEAAVASGQVSIRASVRVTFQLE